MMTSPDRSTNLATPGDAETDRSQSSRLTFRQKFWLFGVGLPVLLMIVLLALAVFLPKPLNPTEEKLVGRWEVVDPPSFRDKIIEFHTDHLISCTTGTPYYWNADEKTLTFDVLEDWSLWARLKVRFGFTVQSTRYEIHFIDEQEMQLVFTGARKATITLRRSQSLQY